MPTLNEQQFPHEKEQQALREGFITGPNGEVDMNHPFNKSQMTPNPRFEAPDLAAHYGKSIKFAYVPKENYGDGSKEANDEWERRQRGPDKGVVAHLAAITPSFDRWADASHTPTGKRWAKNWKEEWATMPRYKQHQYRRAIAQNNRNN